MSKRRIWCMVIVAALAACGRDSKAPTQEAPMSGSNPTAGSSAAPQTVNREIDVKDTGGSAKLRLKVPAGWTTESLGVALRDEYQEAIAGVQFTVLCEGNCGDDEVARVPKVVDSTLETKAKPNVGTGNPEMDAVRLKVDVVEQGDIPDGVFRVARITKPPGLEGPYREQIYAVCVRVKRGARMVAAQAWAPLAKQSELGPVIVNACKTFEIL